MLRQRIGRVSGAAENGNAIANADTAINRESQRCHVH